MNGLLLENKNQIVAISLYHLSVYALANFDKKIIAPSFEGDLRPTSAVVFPSYSTSDRDQEVNLVAGSVIFNTDNKKLKKGLSFFIRKK